MLLASPASSLSCSSPCRCRSSSRSAPRRSSGWCSAAIRSKCSPPAWSARRRTGSCWRSRASSSPAPLMERCGMSHALVDLARALVGWLRGGLGMSVIVVSYFFSDICGSKMAEVSALGSTLMPPLRRAGYRPEDGASLIASGHGDGHAGAAGDLHDRDRRSDQHLGGRAVSRRLHPGGGDRGLPVHPGG